MDLCECVFLGKRLPDHVLWHVALDSGWVPAASAITPAILSEMCRDLVRWDRAADEELVQWMTTITSPARRARVAASVAAAAKAKEIASAAAASAAASAAPSTISDSGAGDAVEASGLVASHLFVAENTDDSFAFQRVSAAPLGSTRARVSLL